MICDHNITTDLTLDNKYILIYCEGKFITTSFTTNKVTSAHTVEVFDTAQEVVDQGVALGLTYGPERLLEYMERGATLTPGMFSKLQSDVLALDISYIDRLALLDNISEEIISLAIQYGVISWHNYTSSLGRIITGATSDKASGWKDELAPGGVELFQPNSSTWHPTYTINKLYFNGGNYLSAGVSRIGNTGLFAGPNDSWTVIAVAEYDNSGYSISKASESLANRQFGIFHDVNAGIIGVIIRGYGDGLNRVNYTAGTPIFTAVTWHGPTSTCLLYFGSDSPKTLTVGTAPEDNNSPILIGARVGGFHLTGSMYHDQIFDTTKTAEQIANLRIDLGVA